MNKIMYDTYESVEDSLEKIKKILIDLDEIDSELEKIKFNNSTYANIQTALDNAKQAVLSNVLSIGTNIKKDIKVAIDAKSEFITYESKTNSFLDTNFNTAVSLSEMGNTIYENQKNKTFANPQNMIALNNFKNSIDAPKTVVNNESDIEVLNVEKHSYYNTEKKVNISSTKKETESEPINNETKKETESEPINNETKKETESKPINNVKETSIIDYKTKSVDGNRLVAGNSGCTVNEVLTKIKDECIKQDLEEHWVDVCAISLLETGTYTSESFINNNVGGLSYADGKTRYSFPTLDEGISKFVSNLKNNYYDKGLTTIDSIGLKYCPTTASAWAESVTVMKNQLKSCL